MNTKENQEEIKYDILKPWLTLDPWQSQYIETEGNCFLLCGRQVGKSTAASIKAGELAVHKHKAGEHILMIATTERQAYQLFFKTLNYLTARYPNMIKKGKDKPTKHEINLTNGVKIMCHPTGLQGEGLRGFTCKKIFADEAARMDQEIFVAVTPMLAVTGGSIDLLSTPAGKEDDNYFYKASLREDFIKFYVSAEDCPRHSKSFLESEKNSMSELRYAQEYLAVFLDDLKRVFPDHLIKKCCVRKRPNFIDKGNNMYLGVDIARMGDDESTFEILQKTHKDKFVQVENIVTRKTLTTETQNKILELDKLYNFKRIYIDAGAGSLGVGIYDNLRDTSVKHKIEAINNATRVLDLEGKKTTRLLKEDLYDNLRSLMERGKIELLDDDELIQSLKSVVYEYVKKENKKTQLVIYGNYTHIAEGLIRAAWGIKDKHLNLWVEYN